MRVAARTINGKGDRQILMIDAAALERAIGPAAAARVLERAEKFFDVVPIYVNRPPSKKPGIGDNGGPPLESDESRKTTTSGSPSPPPEKPDLRKYQLLVKWLLERKSRADRDKYTGPDGADTTDEEGTAVGVTLDPRVGEPAAGRNYRPDNESHRKGLRGEYGLANDIAEHVSGHTVVDFGRKAGERGPDVISVNRNGEVTFWDSKWRSSDTSIGRSLRAHKTDGSFEGALEHAKCRVASAMKNGRLSLEVGKRALENLRNGNATIVTVGTGSARNGVIEQIVGGRRAIVHPQ